MSHNIFGSRFYSYRVPAWHNLVPPSDIPMTAVEAIKAVAGDIEYSLEPINVSIGGQAVPLVGQVAIVRHPTLDDGLYRAMGVVSNMYRLIPPRVVAELWDAKVDRLVETAGVLKQGAEIFLTTKLPAWDVTPGDRVEQYMICRIPMDGKSALEVRQAPVRVVCWNTLTLSEKLAVKRYVVPHLADAEHELGRILDMVWGMALEKQAIIREAYDILANAKLDGDTHARSLLDDIYSEPEEPSNEDNVMSDRRYAAAMKRHQGLVRTRGNKIDGVMRLWSGEDDKYRVSGGEFEGMQGTAWRLYQSITELENWGWYSTPQGRANSVLYGERGRVMAKAFDVLIAEASTITERPLSFLN